MRTLIVDDSSFIREYMKQLLEPLGVACEEASDGKVALRRLRDDRGSIDLMLCDLNMPNMGGLECVKRLRAAGLHPEMKVMMVTTEADHSFIHDALQFGADEFLMKPFTAQSFREKLELLGFVLAA